MHAGKLRHRITIQRLTGARDTFGAETDAWETFKRCWAEVKPAFGSQGGGREVFLMGQQLQAISDVVITMRYMAGITTKDRVSFGDRTFEILATHNRDERNREMELICKEYQ